MVLGAEYLSYVKSIEIHARAFLPLDISAISSVHCVFMIFMTIIENVMNDIKPMSVKVDYIITY